MRNLTLGYIISESELSGYTKTFKTVFLKHFVKCLLLQITILLLKLGIRKDSVAVSVIKELINKHSLPNVFLRLFRVVFRIQLIIYNGAFKGKYLTA